MAFLYEDEWALAQDHGIKVSELIGLLKKMKEKDAEVRILVGESWRLCKEARSGYDCDGENYLLLSADIFVQENQS